MEKNAKNHLWEDINNCFEEREAFGTKINMTFFVGIDVLNIFLSTTFSKKTIFSKTPIKKQLPKNWKFLQIQGEYFSEITGNF